jgi:AraC-like DNA-binding protein
MGTMSARSTVNVKTVRAAVGAASAAGLDVPELLRRWEIPLASLDDPDFRYPHRRWVELWVEVERLSGDPCVGLHAAERLPGDHFDLFDYLMASSENLGAGLERFERYFAVVSTGVAHRLREAGELVHLERHYAPDAVTRVPHPAEFAFACVVLRTRPLAQASFRPHSVRFAHRAPASAGEHRRIFGCPVTFDAEVSAIAFHRQSLSIPMQSPRPELCRLLDAHAQGLLQRLPPQGDLLDLARRVMVEELRGGDPELGPVARKLGVSGRTLQRRLREAGTSHQLLLDEVRRDLALRYLRDASLAVTEVAFLLGFSDVSNFYRAFRRWTGGTPLEYRKATA